MQLTCANCASRYLVDPAAIGPDGRTVQCFRCGHKWRATLPPDATFVRDAPPATNAAPRMDTALPTDAVPPTDTAPPTNAVPPMGTALSSDVTFVWDAPSARNAAPRRDAVPPADTAPPKPPTPPVPEPVTAVKQNAAAMPEAAVVPDAIIEPAQTSTISNLPVLAARRRMPAWIKIAAALIVAIGLLGVVGYLFGERFVATLGIDEKTTRITYAAGPGSKTVMVITGDIVNIGRAASSATRLRVVFKDAQGKPVGERALAIDTGRIPAHGRAAFEARIDDAPAAATVGIQAD